MKNQCLIVGGGHAAAQLAVSLRQNSWDGPILVVSEEAVLPYHRPPLSKGFIAGEKSLDDILLRQPEYYKTRDIQFKLNTSVVSIDTSNKHVLCENGEQLPYTKLALATGTIARKLSIPGAELNGVHYLRTAADADGIATSMADAKKAVIVGGGYIGLELAASLNKVGIKVTVLETADRVLGRVAAAPLSALYQRVHAEEGVTIKTNFSVVHFTGENSVTSVVCEDGSEFTADFVVVGIGVIPNIAIAEQAGIKIDNGIIVDEYAQTSEDDIVAAGDCTFHPNPILNRNIRLESVPNATEQAKTAAATICGLKKPYQALPWFWSDQFDLKLQITGLNHDYDAIKIRGDIQSSRSVAVFYLKNNHVIAVDCVNRAPEFAATKNALSKGFDMLIDSLEDESVAPRDLLIKPAG